MWKPIELEYDNMVKSGTLLYDIADGKYSALLIRDFYDKDSCRTVANRITDISALDYGTGVVKKVGTFLMAYVNKKHDYFSDAANVGKRFDTLFYDVEDPRNSIHELIAYIMSAKVTVAEDKGRKYAAGIIRIHETGDFAPLHRDNAMVEATEFTVSRFQHQLSCVLYIQQTESGGELVIYNRVWKLPDERFREIGFGYSKQVITDNTESVIIKADAGDLVIINPNYYHAILTVTGKTPRITLGLFMAFNDNEQTVVTWS